MTIPIDLAAVLAPISAESPAGEDLRYTSVYDEIREARRADDPEARGEWQREIKASDWHKVASLSLAALTGRSKDLQIAAWLAEALAMTGGFVGCASGMAALAGLLGSFWDDAFPLIEDDDYDYRVAPFEFLNDKLAGSVRLIPLTDPRQTPGYSYLKWQESREVGYEAEARRGAREEMLSEGKLAPEDFDAAVANSSAAFYQALAKSVTGCLEGFRTLDAEVNRSYGRHAPRLSDLGEALEGCQRLILKICREQKGLQDSPDQAAAQGTGSAGACPASDPARAVAQGTDSAGACPPSDCASTDGEEALPAAAPPGGGGADTETPQGASAVTGRFALPEVNAGLEPQETKVWNEALRIMQGGDLKEALNLLLAAAGRHPSERGRSRYRFLVAKLCLKGGRPELARPILEQLNALIAELQLEKWECPFWISEIYEALYHCLLSGEGGDEESTRAKELFRKICTMDVTKALDSRP